MKKPRDVTFKQRRMFLLYNEMGSIVKVANLFGISKQAVHQNIKNYHKAIAARQEYKKWVKSYKPKINPKTGRLIAYKPPVRKVDPETHYFSRLKNSEEGRKLVSEWGKLGNKSHGKSGVPQGYTAEIIEPIRKSAKRKAKRMVKKVAEENGIDDEYAKQALETVAEIMNTPGSDAERLKAAKVMLEFKHAKPVAKSEISVHKAEDFLASLVEDD
jgi:hypothetical protein